MRRPDAAVRWLRGLMAVLVLTLAVPSTPRAAPDTINFVDEWVSHLDEAGNENDMAAAIELIVGDMGDPGAREHVEGFLTDAFGETGFRADTLWAIDKGVKGERRVLALYHEARYAYLMVVFHRREAGWKVIYFNLQGSLDKFM